MWLIGLFSHENPLKRQYFSLFISLFSHVSPLIPERWIKQLTIHGWELGAVMSSCVYVYLLCSLNNVERGCLVKNPDYRSIFRIVLVSNVIYLFYWNFYWHWWMLRQRHYIAIHQFTYHQFTYFARYHQFTYFARRRGAIRERDEGTVHITYTQ
jgi:hypothetical protein